MDKWLVGPMDWCNGLPLNTLQIDPGFISRLSLFYLRIAFCPTRFHSLEHRIDFVNKRLEYSPDKKYYK